MSDTELVKIEASTRSTCGNKGYSRRLRLDGKVPGNLIGSAKSTPIELKSKLLSKAWKNGKVFNLVLDGVEKRVRIHELQINPVKRTPIHVDVMEA